VTDTPKTGHREDPLTPTLARRLGELAEGREGVMSAEPIPVEDIRPDLKEEIAGFSKALVTLEKALGERLAA
jgi:hypothetical protein